MELLHTGKAVRVLVVDDQAAIRDAIAAEFEPDPHFEIVGEAASLAEARKMLTSADLVLLDLVLSDGSGVELIPELHRTNPTAQAIVLSASYDRALHVQALEHGAAAVLDKIKHLGQLVQAIRHVLTAE